MLASLALIFLLGLAAALLCQRFKLPSIVGLLAVGIVLGPHLLNWLDPSILAISADLRKIALIIILLKAGFSLNLQDLKKVGRPALLMAFLPSTLEILAFTFIGPYLFKIDYLEAALMGSVLAAVSPAVTVPKMVKLIETKYGTAQSIPQLILASASCDGIFAVVIFSTLLSIAQGSSLHIVDLAKMPVSVITGILAGAILGYLLNIGFEAAYQKHHHMRGSLKVIVVLGMSFALVSLENCLQQYVAFSGLLAIVSMACILKQQGNSKVTGRLAEKFGKLWFAAELILFVLVGAAVDINYALAAGFSALAMIAVALIFRAIGVYCCLMATDINLKERLFCAFAYIPKATIQAAIGSVPLAVGLPCGQIILSVAVLAILLTSPLGELCLELSYKKLLQKED